MTPSEKYISDLCTKSFLPFWSFPSPLRKKDKELCDILVVCGNSVIIISVKDISVTSSSDETVQYERWVKKAIYESTDQIYGAERFLDSVTEVYCQEKKNLIKLPLKENRKTYRIAIAFGSKKYFPFPTGNFGKGFVHVFDEQSTDIIFNELDTISDFTKYLDEKENIFKDRKVMLQSEADLLAFYLEQGLAELVKADTILIDNGLWKKYTKSKSYMDWTMEIKVSFFWDYMISNIYKYHITPESTNEKRIELEGALRIINLEDRTTRIALGKMLNDAIEKKVKARMLKPIQNTNHTYVIMPLTDDNWETKEKELKLRSIVARADNPTIENIIGIGVGKGPSGENWYDVCFLCIPVLTTDVIEQANSIKAELGYFKNPTFTKSREITG